MEQPVKQWIGSCLNYNSDGRFGDATDLIINRDEIRPFLQRIRYQIITRNILVLEINQAWNINEEMDQIIF
jgi:hypothetical protein